MITNETADTDQIKIWSGQFGIDYTDRSLFIDAASFNKLYYQRYGFSRHEIIEYWLSDVPRDARVLEIGCNIGNQLAALQRAGFSHLYGIDIQRHAIKKSHECFPDLDTIVGSAFDLPFRDRFFDLVFTNNVLIHIAPSDIGEVFKEMERVCKHWVWGFEYYSSEFEEIDYRGNKNLLWKGDYGTLFVEQNNDFNVEKEKVYACLDEPGLEDKCYLLKRGEKT